MSILHTVFQSVRVRLLVIALVPMLILLPLLLGSTVLRWSGKVDDTLITKVNGDLTIANQYLLRLVENSGERLASMTASAAFRDTVDDPEAREALLSEARQRMGLDFLYLTDGQTSPNGFAPSTWPVILDALEGEWHSAIDILSAEDLDALSGGLATKAAVPLVETQAAVPTDRKVEDRGLIIHSAAPATLTGGARGALVGGRLLNRNLDFIDTINALVYREKSLPEGSQGTATLFLEDVRVSTNVRLFEGVRALGTRVSAEVRRDVLDNGDTWLDHAFVVNDWYISAYEPLVDSRGTRVGMLYVGFLETPFREAKTYSIIGIAVLFLLIATVSVPIFLRWVGRIFKPLERMTQTIEKVDAGQLEARNKPGNARGEIAQVARRFDGLLDGIQERDRQLRDWADSLERKVDERTRELQSAIHELELATEQLIISEKLAAVGEITASVAHEINNPIAVIQGNLDVSRRLLAGDLKKVKTEFSLIDEQIYRISVMVSKLLQFAKPEEYHVATESVLAVEAVSDCLLLTRHQIENAEIDVITCLESERYVFINRTELQQVIVNLMLNAAHAMANGGTLRLTVRDEGEGVAILVEDTGHGIRPEDLKRIFDPFFTTKQADGTGLGLSISQKIVKRAGGEITAQSSTQGGSCFKVFLPQENYRSAASNFQTMP
ncbi:two-component sensor histidine kinase [Ruegeria sp. PBVC088]|nr:two-component sensor histidine kinase [Ruegeria sp. PBVC088]